MTTRRSVDERTGTSVAETRPQRWSRLWANLWTKRPGITEEGRGALALHHAETTRRAREAMIEIVRAGYQIGPPPYGYRALRIRVTDPSGHSKLRAVLVPDWQTAAVVKQIFAWRADDGLTFAAIAARLNADLRQYPAPSERWTAKAVRRIVTNAKYTGRQVWARTVAGRPAPVKHWVISAPMVHEPLVDERVFRRAQQGAGEELRCA
ncbi:recombinase family protein [Amycolatopsis sp. NPDC003865]